MVAIDYVAIIAHFSFLQVFNRCHSCKIQKENRSENSDWYTKRKKLNIPHFLNSSYLSSHSVHLELDYILQWYFLRTLSAIREKRKKIQYIVIVYACANLYLEEICSIVLFAVEF